MLEEKNLESIDTLVKNHNIVLFMKGTKSFPQCGFSGTVVNILDKLGIDFKDVNVLEDEQIRQGIKKYSDWPTIPQLYVKGEFIGGCDIVKELYSTGKLEDILK